MEYKWFKRFYREKPNKVWSGYSDSWITNFTCKLGKIGKSDFGLLDHDYLGLMIGFEHNSGSVATDYTHNMYKGCNYESIIERNAMGQELLQVIHDMLKDAKVDTIAELKNIPVELYYLNRTLIAFRILTEVL